MSSPEDQGLAKRQAAMQALWEKHLAAEFQAKDAHDSCETMTDLPYVNHVPVLTGGVGREQLEHFYATYFIPQMPPDVEMVPISRTIGHDRIVDEFIFRFTHTVEMPWMLPGVPPTGKRVESVFVVIIGFENGKISHEHIHWDQASVLVQLGLIDPAGLPVAGAETARKMLDRSAMPSNLLIKRTNADERI